MVTLRNIWKDIVSLFKPEGHPEAVTVEPGQTVEVPGELADEQPHDDAIVVDQPSGEKLAYPKALWEHVPDAPAEASTSGDAAPAETATPAPESSPPAETATPAPESSPIEPAASSAPEAPAAPSEG